MAKAKHMEVRHIKKLLKNKISCITIVCFIIFIFSTIKITIWLTSNISMQNQIEDLKKEVVIENTDQTDEIKRQIDFTKLKEINKDIVAWIEIPETSIDYPVFQAKDNEYYLKKDIYKNYNSSGSIFLDCKNIPDFKDDNTVIYGHNLRSGKMFADLQKIVGNQLGNNIIINIFTEESEKKYKVFSSYIAEPTIDPINTILKDKSSFIKNVISKSNVNFSTMPNEEDMILTLSTCDNKGKRIIVHAVEI